MTKPCSICQKPSKAKFEPFCSKRCADIDLGRWLKGTYVIEGRDGEAGSLEGSSQSDNDDLPTI